MPDDTRLEDLHRRIDNDFAFHPGTNETIPKHEKVRQRFRLLAHFVAEIAPLSREQSLALTALQEAAMWTNAAIACNEAPAEMNAEDRWRP